MATSNASTAPAGISTFSVWSPHGTIQKVYKPVAFSATVPTFPPQTSTKPSPQKSISPSTTDSALTAGVWYPGKPVPTLESEQKELSEKQKEDQSLRDVPVCWSPSGAKHAKAFRPVKLDTSARTLSNGSVSSPDGITSSSATIKPSAIMNDTVTMHKQPGSTALHLPRTYNPTVTLLQKSRDGSITSSHESPTTPTSVETKEGQFPKGAVYVDGEKQAEDNAKLPERSKDLSDGGSTTVIKTNAEEARAVKPVSQTSPGTTGDEEKTPDWQKDVFKPLSVVVKPKEKQYHSTSSLELQDSSSPGKSFTQSKKHNSLERNKKSSWSPPSARNRIEVYKNQPRKIEEYEPGFSSIAFRQAKVSPYFFNPPPDLPGQFSSYTLPARIKIPSDSDGPVSAHSSSSSPTSESKELYKQIQQGGEIPHFGLRKTLPEKTSDAESPHNKPSPESSPPAPAQRSPHGSWDRRRRDEADERRRIRVQQITEEEKKKKAIQEQLDAQARRHSDYFTPAQKSPIPTDRFDKYQGKNMKKKPEIHGKARALYNFSAQSPRELSFRKGDIILLIKKVDKNWFEGEHHGKTGLFPVNYVEVITSVEAAHLQDLVSEGQAVAKFNFTAQTKVEMSVKKGEVVVLIRRVDENWYEAKIGSRHGIVPVSYLEVVREPTKRAFSPISVSSSHPMSPVNYNGPLSPTPGAPARPQQPVSWSPTQRSASPSSQTRTQYSPQSSPRTIHARSIVTKQSSPPHDQHPGSAYSTQTWSPTYRSASPRDYTDAGGRPAQNRVAPPSGHSGSQPQSFSTQTWTGGSPSLVRATDVHRGAPDVGYTQEIRAPSPTTFSSITMSTSVKDKDKKKKHIIVQPAPISEHQTSVNLQQTVIPQQIPVFKCEGEDEFLPYQAVYPYHPQNEDELELKEKDIVYVMEKCDDGWFVGTCVRTGQFGTFPGNYVEPVYATVYRAPGSLEIQLAPN
ncbi:sorbin and SH3 domain-containing protein 1-like isoform X3 [Lingula anatina]|uniref:Sorbin and SH3 domain-containing protein 1-like isoform X3 n=1 Tax=Lingula anatina TaxID=7574 RepID=A0A1S3K143_LINAN|nr:sorbin and SH3 domain-containing protein 1-like isoform X3 [Lingula anatina]XP_013416194.1 sorbin and SH3 domain-containing protein 1-like isoform X3 [Lingula anatina]XP_013416275.1 sorbin and SH3 domain-containing protein 1-like isoform X3 [Lingula anatina]XP_013416353.1 sorbin and SH3 domain-containing protein 1-like isoform X3 [Lingula anatina]|eukprot:XP_013416125.1 sorbin and SH3 domain-containing protein 1-like isoform X3 [Lingula anatina]